HAIKLIKKIGGRLVLHFDGEIDARDRLGIEGKLTTGQLSSKAINVFKANDLSTTKPVKIYGIEVPVQYTEVKPVQTGDSTLYQLKVKDGFRKDDIKISSFLGRKISPRVISIAVKDDGRLYLQNRDGSSTSIKIENLPVATNDSNNKGQTVAVTAFIRGFTIDGTLFGELQDKAGSAFHTLVGSSHSGTSPEGLKNHDIAFTMVEGSDGRIYQKATLRSEESRLAFTHNPLTQQSAYLSFIEGSTKVSFAFGGEYTTINGVAYKVRGTHEIDSIEKVDGRLVLVFKGSIDAKDGIGLEGELTTGQHDGKLVNKFTRNMVEQHTKISMFGHEVPLHFRELEPAEAGVPAIFGLTLSENFSKLGMTLSSESGVKIDPSDVIIVTKDGREYFKDKAGNTVLLKFDKVATPVNDSSNEGLTTEVTAYVRGFTIDGGYFGDIKGSKGDQFHSPIRSSHPGTSPEGLRSAHLTVQQIDSTKDGKVDHLLINMKQDGAKLAFIRAANGETSYVPLTSNCDDVDILNSPYGVTVPGLNYLINEGEIKSIHKNADGTLTVKLGERVRVMQRLEFVTFSENIGGKLTGKHRKVVMNRLGFLVTDKSDPEGKFKEDPKSFTESKSIDGYGISMPQYLGYMKLDGMLVRVMATSYDELKTIDIQLVALQSPRYSATIKGDGNEVTQITTLDYKGAIFALQEDGSLQFRTDYNSTNNLARDSSGEIRNYNYTIKKDSRMRLIAGATLFLQADIIANNRDSAIKHSAPDKALKIRESSDPNKPTSKAPEEPETIINDKDSTIRGLMHIENNTIYIKPSDFIAIEDSRYAQKGSESLRMRTSAKKFLFEHGKYGTPYVWLTGSALNAYYNGIPDDYMSALAVDLHNETALGKGKAIGQKLYYFNSDEKYTYEIRFELGTTRGGLKHAYAYEIFEGQNYAINKPEVKIVLVGIRKGAYFTSRLEPQGSMTVKEELNNQTMDTLLKTANKAKAVTLYIKKDTDEWTKSISTYRSRHLSYYKKVDPDIVIAIGQPSNYVYLNDNEALMAFQFNILSAADPKKSDAGLNVHNLVTVIVPNKYQGGQGEEWVNDVGGKKVTFTLQWKYRGRGAEGKPVDYEFYLPKDHDGPGVQYGLQGWSGKNTAWNRDVYQENAEIKLKDKKGNISGIMYIQKGSAIDRYGRPASGKSIGYRNSSGFYMHRKQEAITGLTIEEGALARYDDISDQDVEDKGVKLTKRKTGTYRIKLDSTGKAIGEDRPITYFSEDGSYKIGAETWFGGRIYQNVALGWNRAFASALAGDGYFGGTGNGIMAGFNTITFGATLGMIDITGKYLANRDARYDNWHLAYALPLNLAANIVVAYLNVGTAYNLGNIGVQGVRGLLGDVTARKAAGKFFGEALKRTITRKTWRTVGIVGGISGAVGGSATYGYNLLTGRDWHKNVAGNTLTMALLAGQAVLLRGGTAKGATIADLLLVAPYTAVTFASAHYTYSTAVLGKDGGWAQRWSSLWIGTKAAALFTVVSFAAAGSRATYLSKATEKGAETAISVTRRVIWNWKDFAGGTTGKMRALLFISPVKFASWSNGLIYFSASRTMFYTGLSGIAYTTWKNKWHSADENFGIIKNAGIIAAYTLGPIFVISIFAEGLPAMFKAAAWKPGEGFSGLLPSAAIVSQTPGSFGLIGAGTLLGALMNPVTGSAANAFALSRALGIGSHMMIFNAWGKGFIQPIVRPWLAEVTGLGYSSKWVSAFRSFGVQSYSEQMAQGVIFGFTLAPFESALNVMGAVAAKWKIVKRISKALKRTPGAKIGVYDEVLSLAREGYIEGGASGILQMLGMPEHIAEALVELIPGAGGGSVKSRLSALFEDLCDNMPQLATILDGALPHASIGIILNEAGIKGDDARNIAASLTQRYGFSIELTTTLDSLINGMKADGVTEIPSHRELLIDIYDTASKAGEVLNISVAALILESLRQTTAAPLSTRVLDSTQLKRVDLDSVCAELNDLLSTMSTTLPSQIKAEIIEKIATLLDKFSPGSMTPVAAEEASKVLINLVSEVLDSDDLVDDDKGTVDEKKARAAERGLAALSKTSEAIGISIDKTKDPKTSAENITKDVTQIIGKVIGSGFSNTQKTAITGAGLTVLASMGSGVSRAFMRDMNNQDVFETAKHMVSAIDAMLKKIDIDSIIANISDNGLMVGITSALLSASESLVGLSKLTNSAKYVANYLIGVVSTILETGFAQSASVDNGLKEVGSMLQTLINSVTAIGTEATSTDEQNAANKLIAKTIGVLTNKQLFASSEDIDPIIVILIQSTDPKLKHINKATVEAIDATLLNITKKLEADLGADDISTRKSAADQLTLIADLLVTRGDIPIGIEDTLISAFGVVFNNDGAIDDLGSKAIESLFVSFVQTARLLAHKGLLAETDIIEEGDLVKKVSDIINAVISNILSRSESSDLIVTVLSNIGIAINALPAKLKQERTTEALSVLIAIAADTSADSSKTTGAYAMALELKLNDQIDSLADKLIKQLKDNTISLTPAAIDVLASVIEKHHDTFDARQSIDVYEILLSAAGGISEDSDKEQIASSAKLVAAAKEMVVANAELSEDSANRFVERLVTAVVNNLSGKQIKDNRKDLKSMADALNSKAKEGVLKVIADAVSSLEQESDVAPTVKELPASESTNLLVAGLVKDIS
ncbi:hypothetical protein ACFL0T_07770, partial [Candidatus Omnitrophota bacterium]